MSEFLPPLRPTFDAALRDVEAKSPRARLAATEILSAADQSERGRVLPALRPLVDDAHPAVRFAAIAALGRLQDTHSTTRIAARVDDEDRAVREAAVIALSDLGGEEAQARILALLSSESPELRFQATGSLHTLLGEQARPYARKALQDADPKVRGQAALVLGELTDDRETRDAMARLLRDESEPQLDAAIALAHLGDARGAAVLARALESREHALEAAEALLDLSAPKNAREALAKRGQAYLAPLMLKAACGAALARGGDPRGVEILRAVLGAFRPDGRTYAAAVIGELDLSELASELGALLRKPRGADPETVALSLARLARAGDAQSSQILSAARAASSDLETLIAWAVSESNAVPAPTVPVRAHEQRTHEVSAHALSADEENDPSAD